MGYDFSGMKHLRTSAIYMSCTLYIYNTKNNLLLQIRKHECLSLQNVKCLCHEPVSKASSIFDF